MKNEITTFEGFLSAEGKKIAIVAARFNEFIVQKLIGGAQDAFIRHFGLPQDLNLIWVPGAFEIPFIARKVAQTKNYDAVVCLGAVIRGSTPHFDYVASEVSKGVAQASWETGIPIIFGVLTTDTIEQAIERAGTKQGNKGHESMMSAIEMSDLMKKIQL